MRHDLQPVRDDLLELSGLFARVCANSREPGVASMRSIFRTVGSLLLPYIDTSEKVPADERAAIRLALGRLRERRVALDDDITETRLRLDARLVVLERHVKDALDLDPAFAASAANNLTPNVRIPKKEEAKPTTIRLDVKKKLTTPA